MISMTKGIEAPLSGPSLRYPVFCASFMNGETTTVKTLKNYEKQYLRLRKKKSGVPYGIRTRVTSVKGRCPGPLDEGNKADK